MIPNTINVSLLVIGALFLVVGLFYINKITKVTSILTSRWRILAALIFFFIFAYVVFILMIYTFSQSNLVIIAASAVFLESGVLIGIITGISLHTLIQLKQVSLIKYEAQHDDLTGIYNRRYFMRELNILLEQIKRGGPECILLFMDFNKFKDINDKYGHMAGDSMLTEAANIFANSVRKTDIVARLGGDEFVILLFNTQVNYAEKIAGNLIEKVTLYAEQKFTECKDFGCSVGICKIDKNCLNADIPLNRADRACYLAKQSKDQNIRVFTKD